jgi:integrase
MKRQLKPWNPEDGEKFELATAGNAAVKIYRRERATIKGETRYVYEIADYTTGARKLRGFGKLEKARSEANRIAGQLASGKAEAAAMGNADAISYGNSVEIIRKSKLPNVRLETVCDTWARAIEALGGADRIIEACTFFKQHGADEIIPRTVAEVVTDLIANRQAAKKSDRYVDDLRARLNRFSEKFAVDISSITTADVQNWLDGLKLSPRSTKNFKGALGTLFKFAEARHYIGKGANPITGTETVTTNGDGQVEIYAPEEMIKLLKHAPKRFMPFLAIGAFAGLRSAEIERLEFKDINLARGFITVQAKGAKTRSRRIVPILPNLAQWLAPYARRKGKVWTGTERDLLDDRAKAVEASGVAWNYNGARHSFCSYRLAEIQDAAKVALEAGNSPAMVFKHYRELVEPAAAKTWFAIAPEKPENVITVNTKASHA